MLNSIGKVFLLALLLAFFGACPKKITIGLPPIEITAKKIFNGKDMTFAIACKIVDNNGNLVSTKCPIDLCLDEGCITGADKTQSGPPAWLGDIRLEGVTAVQRRDLLDGLCVTNYNCLLFVNNSLEDLRWAAHLDGKRIRVYYGNHGYLAADVEVDVIPRTVADRGLRKNDIYFKVKEGRPFRIKQVQFQGLEDNPHRGTIQALFTQKIDDKVDIKRILEDKAAMETLINHLGYKPKSANEDIVRWKVDVYKEQSEVDVRIIFNLEATSQ